MWPFKRKAKTIHLPGSPWDGVEVPDHVIAAAKALSAPVEGLGPTFKAAVEKFGEEAALDWVLRKCDFKRARSEIVDFFRLAMWEAEQQGQQVSFRTTLLEGFEAFSLNPNAETARAWLQRAPESRDMILGYLIESCPGGLFSDAPLRKQT